MSSLPPTTTLQLEITLTIDTASTTAEDEGTTHITASAKFNATEEDRSIAVFTYADAASNAAAIPIPVFVGTLVGVIVFLTLLAVTVVIIIISFVYMRRYNGNQNQGWIEDHGYDYVTETGTGMCRGANPIEMMVNEAYGTSTVEMN